MLKLSDYLEALENERKKIEAFQRELPYCMQLLDAAIESSRAHVAEEPVAEEPVADESVADEPLVEEPVAEDPVAEEAVEGEAVEEGEPAATSSPTTPVSQAKEGGEDEEDVTVGEPASSPTGVSSSGDQLQLAALDGFRRGGDFSTEEQREGREGTSFPERPPPAIPPWLLPTATEWKPRHTSGSLTEAPHIFQPPSRRPPPDQQYEAIPPTGPRTFLSSAQRLGGAFSPFSRAEKPASAAIFPRPDPTLPAIELALGWGSVPGAPEGEVVTVVHAHAEHRVPFLMRGWGGGGPAEMRHTAATSHEGEPTSDGGGDEGNEGGGGEEGGGHGGMMSGDGMGSGRKTRRSWSSDLHKRFLSALGQLGGSQVATPKQIRELMKVQGLTNDEVKSHLQVPNTIPPPVQKYRLYTRRPSVPAAPSHPSPAHKPLVVLGGVWVPPEFTSPLTASVDLPGARHLRPTYPHELYGSPPQSVPSVSYSLQETPNSPPGAAAAPPSHPPSGSRRQGSESRAMRGKAEGEGRRTSGRGTDGQGPKRGGREHGGGRRGAGRGQRGSR